MNLTLFARSRGPVREILSRWTTHQSYMAAITSVNRLVRGWSHYFHYGNCTRVYMAEQDWLRQRVR